MAYGDPELLFYKIPLSGVIEGHRQQYTAAPVNIPENQLLNTPTDDLVAEIIQRWVLRVPVLKEDEAEVDQKEGPITVYDHFRRMDGGDGRMSVHGTIVELNVPFEGERDFFFVRPNTWDTAPPRALVDKTHLTLRITGRDLNGDQVRKSFDGTLADIKKYLAWIETDAAKFNANMGSPIRAAIEARKTKVLGNKSMVANLGYKLRSRPDAPKTYIAPVQRKRIEPTKRAAPRGTAPFKPEPTLDEAQYQEVLKIIEGMAHVMERSPSAFKDTGEEDLRQHFLVQLNGQFEGAASGETFNFQGKTDILIRVEDRNIFIAECKFWKGEKAYLATIDQLLGYLSWRDTKTALIVFNQNKDFSAVMGSIKQATGKHPNFKKGPTAEGESRLRYVFTNPKDANRELIMTVLAFDVPLPT